MRRSTLLFAALLAASSGLAQQAAPRRAPGFSLPDETQTQRDLADYRGRWVLLDFMKTDCPHCGSLTGVLEQAKSRYGDKVAVLSVVLPPDTPQTVAAYKKKRGVNGPFLFDCGQMAFSYIRPNAANPAVTLPHLYVIDPKGLIARDLVYGPGAEGEFEGATLLKSLDALIGARK